ncbi:hypothetical protein SCLCIDRAFT_33498 [Scleroderma citrinum Foug A]|uniref:Nephrocystin 3-like N-terminal domain-containing protein n=1 Tax=Scleroderma citrinum Foug A TaxID=1036808 RepID=A0A0C3CS12_9AGAM|nr:hypothetical protein SCLCIDRAFT_33498 [Scleroderma citrinum Foug A]
MPFMSVIDVGNDTRPVPPRSGKEPGRKQFIEKRNPAPVSGRAAHASGYGSGKSIIIPSGQLFAWQSAGGGTRDQIYGRWTRLYVALGVGLEIDAERTYWSGYPGFTGRGVACLQSFLASHRCCSRPASARFQQTCIPPTIADESLMANTRRSKLKPWKTKPIQVTSDSQFGLTQGTSPALVPNIASTSARSTDITPGKLEKIKNLFSWGRSNQTIVGTSMIMTASIFKRNCLKLCTRSFPHNLPRESTQILQAHEPPKLTSTVDQAVAPVICVHDEIDAAKTEHDGVASPSRATSSRIDTISLTFLEPLRDFNTVVSTIAKVHPYAQLALGLLSCAAKVHFLVDKDMHLTSLVYEFLLEEDTKANLDVMKDTLARITQVVSTSAQFIKNYSETKNFWKRAAKNIFSETQSIVDGYNKALDELMQEFRNRAVRDTYINVLRVLDIFEDLSLDGMAYADGVGLDTMKECLDGMKVEILKEIVDWIHDPDVNVPWVFWLHGQAGRGKSAIAHTIALHYKNAVVRAIKKDNTLKTTHDVMRQWKELLKPLSEESGGSVGNVVVIIDALDESALKESREHILEVLTEAASLPPHFRILLTSRPLANIMGALRDAQHMKAVSLDKVSAENNIHMYVSKQLKDRPDIGAVEINQIWTGSDTADETVKERFGDLMVPTSREGAALLDEMYITVLNSVVVKRQKPLVRFRSLMRQILYTLEPLPMDALHTMCMHFPHEDDRFNVELILDHMGQLLSGVTDHKNPIRLLHSSFHDFLTDQSRSGDYFVGKLDIQADLAVASLGVLHGDLCFNICGLESSYLLNKDVPGLAESVKAKIPAHLSYSCLFWAKHLEATKFDPDLAWHVKGILGNKRILFWFEVLSLLGVLGNAAPALSSVARWSQDMKT